MDPDIKEDLYITFGGDAGPKTCIPNGDSGSNDYYSHGGDPTTQNGGDYPNNPSDLNDWLIVTSDAHGGFWKYLGKDEIDGDQSIGEVNMYWHDSAQTCEFGIQFENQVEDNDGGHGYVKRTVFGDFNNSGVNNRGSVIYSHLYENPTDAITTVSIEAQNAEIQILNISSSRALISHGSQGFNISLNITNSGAHSVYLTNLTLNFTHQASMEDISENITFSLPAPTLPYILRPREVQIFNISCDVGTMAEIGVVTVNGTATGTDISTGTIVYDNNGPPEIFQITILDSYGPEITSIFQNFTYTEGSTGNHLNWTITDYSDPGLYNITQIGSPLSVVNSAWTSGDKISFNVDGLSAGIYTYQINATDSLGNIETNNVTVNVFDQDLTISDLDDISIFAGANGDYLFWYASVAPSAAGDSFNITVNGELAEKSEFSSTKVINFSLDGFNPGEYTIECKANTTAGFAVSDSIVVEINNTTPYITKCPDLTLFNGTDNLDLIWFLIDASVDENNANYMLRKNDTMIDQGLWVDGMIIKTELQHLQPNNYNFTLTIYDGFGLSAADSVFVIIKTTEIEKDPNGDGSDIPRSEYWWVGLVIGIGTAVTLLSAGVFVLFKSENQEIDLKPI